MRVSWTRVGPKASDRRLCEGKERETEHTDTRREDSRVAEAGSEARGYSAKNPKAGCWRPGKLGEGPGRDRLFPRASIQKERTPCTS